MKKNLTNFFIMAFFAWLAWFGWNNGFGFICVGFAAIAGFFFCKVFK